MILLFDVYPRENGDDSSHGTLTSVKTTLMQVTSIMVKKEL